MQFLFNVFFLQHKTVQKCRQNIIWVVPNQRLNVWNINARVDHFISFLYCPLYVQDSPNVSR